MNSIRSPQLLSTNLSTTENKALFMKRKPQIRKKSKKFKNKSEQRSNHKSITVKLLKIGSYNYWQLQLTSSLKDSSSSSEDELSDFSSLALVISPS